MPGKPYIGSGKVLFLISLAVDYVKIFTYAFAYILLS